MSIVFYNSSTCGYHFIMKKLANQLERRFKCLGENRANCKTFSVPIEKEVTKIDKNGNESVVTISYETNFIDGASLMKTPLSNLSNNLTEGIHKIKCKDFEFKI